MTNRTTEQSTEMSAAQRRARAEIDNLTDLHTDDTFQLEVLLDKITVDGDDVIDAGIDKVLTEVRAMIARAVADTWQAATEHIEAIAVCWTQYDHDEQAADEYGYMPEQVAQMGEALAAWPAFVRDLRAGMTLDAALGRLPVAEYWRVT